MTLQEINNLTHGAVTKLCDQLGLGTSGDYAELRERLRQSVVCSYTRNSDGSLTRSPPANTPDGLIIHKQEGVGLVVSAAEHNFKLSEWQAREADLMRVLKHAEESSRRHQDRVAELVHVERRLNAAIDIICDEFGYTREQASAWLDGSD